MEKVVDLARKRFYWPRMAMHIQHYIRKQCRCIVNKAPNIQERAPLVPIKATYPFQIVSVDYLLLDKCKGGYQYVLVVTDHFIWFCQLYAIKAKSSKAAADKLFNEFILQFVYPEKIHHDQGGEFNSNLFSELHRLTGIKSSRTTPYHLMGDGQVERLNRTLINMLKSLPDVGKVDWRKHLPKLAFAYNSTTNKSTGFSPFYLMFGRESRLPIDYFFQDMESNVIKNGSHKRFIEEWEKSMEEAIEVARRNIGRSAAYNKHHYDKRAKAVEMKLEDLVLMRNKREKGGTGKLQSYWEEAIFKVIEKKENLPVYKIKNIKKVKDIRVIHRNLLMKCEELPLDTFEKKLDRNKGRCRLKVVGEQKMSSKTVQDAEDELEDVAVIYHGESPSLDDNMDPVNNC